ncbi:DMT family transporter [Vibrio sp. HN007]|uniref:DMT family transporter n=1 Tax=Vibrio iocasae TaxID=3098914 RepID=UPI0035D512CD
MSNSTTPKMVLLASIAAVSMGTIGILARLSELDAATVTFFRLFIGGGLLLVLMLVTGQTHQLRKKPHPLILLNGVMLAGFMTLFIASLSYTTMLIAVMTLYMAPAVASIVAHFLLKERLSFYSISSIAVVLFGFTLVMYQPEGSATEQTSWLGFLFALGGMACYAGFILINRMIPSDYQEFTKCSWQFLVGALCVAPMLINTELSLTVSQWGWMLLTGMFPGFLGIVLAVYTIKRMPAATFSTISYVEPIAAVMLGWLVFQESLTPLQMLGCSIIIVASIAQGMKPANRETAPAN